MLKLAVPLRVACAVAVSVLLTAGVSTAANITITLDAGTIPAGVVCGQVWQEAGVSMNFANTEAIDCSGAGNCFFGANPGFGPNDIALFPSRFVVDLTTIPGTVTAAEVDVIDFCGIGCTSAFLEDGAVLVSSDFNTVVSSQETLSLTSGVFVPDLLAVSSCEGAVVEIRITFTGSVPTENSTWGGIKALFATTD
jgi:hypothetical protein